MRVEAYVLIFTGAFFGVVAIVYGLLSSEWSGTAMLLGTMLLGFFPGSYYFWWSARMKPRPEDDPLATHEESAGVVAVFPASSIWPFFIGLGATLVCLALVFGIWTASVGLTLGGIALVGVIRESRRGGLV